MLAYMPGTIMKNTSIMMKILNAAVANFFPLDRHLPFQFRWNQNSTVTPQVNHDRSRDEEMFSSELNTGMALAMIQTTTQKSVTAKIHTAQSTFLLVSGRTSEDRLPREELEEMDRLRDELSLLCLRERNVLMWRMKKTWR